MKTLRTPLLLAAVLLAVAPLAPAAEAGKKPGKAAAAEKPAEGVPPAVADAMSKLVEAAIQHAAVDLAKGVDDFLPYGVLQLKSGELRHVAWTRPNPPPPMDVLTGIVVTLREQARQNPQVVAAITVAPSAVQTVDGQTVKGMRCEVDHRDGAPRVVFIPYTRENGKVVTGTMLYLAGPNPVFERAAAPAATPAAPAAAAKATTKKTP